MTGTPNDAMPARGVPEYGGPQVMDLTGDGHPELVLVNWRPAYGACGVVDFHVLSDLPTGLVELRVRVSGGVESVPGGAWDSIGLVPPNPNDLDDGEHYVLGGTTCVCSDKDLSCTTGLNHPRQEHVRMKWNGRVFIEASRVREVQQ
jgi:hypothetical protein